MLVRTLVLLRSQWAANQAKDLYVREARRHGYIARSAFKLLQLDEQHGLMSKSETMVAIDLGASPGGWCQVIRERAHPTCMIYGVDTIELRTSIPNAHFIHGDFTSEQTQMKLLEAMDAQQAIGKVDLVTSDMCPNRSGGGEDRQRIAALNGSALKFATHVLKPGGHFVCKLLGSRVHYEELLRTANKWFTTSKESKPPASRGVSDELFLVCKRKLVQPRTNVANTAIGLGGTMYPKGNERFSLDDWPGMARRGRSR